MFLKGIDLRLYRCKLDLQLASNIVGLGIVRLEIVGLKQVDSIQVDSIQVDPEQLYSECVAMVLIAKGYLLVYSILLLVGGLVGYAKAKSKISLFTGIGSAIVALIGFIISWSKVSLGLGIGAILGLALTIIFIQRYRKTQTFMPAGLLSILSVIAALISGLALLFGGTSAASIATLWL